MNILVRKLHPAAHDLVYARDGDAGFDLHVVEDYVLAPGERRLLSTGLALEIPPGFFGAVVPRSSSAFKRGLGVVNSPGVVDAGYRGEVFVAGINVGFEDLVLSEGERVAQLIVMRFEQVGVLVVDDLSSSERGAGGFGSTGI